MVKIDVVDFLSDKIVILVGVFIYTFIFQKEINLMPFFVFFAISLFLLDYLVIKMVGPKYFSKWIVESGLGRFTYRKDYNV